MIMQRILVVVMIAGGLGACASAPSAEPKTAKTSSKDTSATKTSATETPPKKVRKSKPTADLSHLRGRCSEGSVEVGDSPDSKFPLCMSEDFYLEMVEKTRKANAGELDLEPSGCSKDPKKEAPIRAGHLGSGSRYVRLKNNGNVTLQARILDAKLKPVMKGTLRIRSGSEGEFRVPPGTYYLRYRIKRNCQVIRSKKPVVIEEKHAGATIALKPIFVVGSSHKTKKVKEEL